MPGVTARRQLQQDLRKFEGDQLTFTSFQHMGVGLMNGLTES